LLDGWSLPVLMGELMADYEAVRAGRWIELPAPRPYRDFVAWVRSRDHAEAEKFWRGWLSGYTEPLVLAIGKVAVGEAEKALEAANDGDSHRVEEVAVSVEVTTRLGAEARRRGVTLNTLVQAAWTVLLARYTGQTDLVFGVVVSGRSAELRGVERMVGLFVNTVPCRVAVPGAAQLDAWVQELAVRQVESSAHEHCALTEVQTWSDVPAGRGLFETIYAFENFPSGDALAHGNGVLEVREPALIERTHYPLAMIVVPGERLRLKANYAAARFRRTAMVRLLGHFAQLLESMAAGDARTVGDLEMLPKAERAALTRLTAPSTMAGVTVASENFVHHRFMAEAKRAPYRVALTCGAERLTYGELAAKAAALARRLRARGVGPGVSVGLCGERDVWLIVGLLGILEAGGAYLPLDPAYPAERLTFMVEDSGVRVIVGGRAVAEKLEGTIGLAAVEWVEPEAADGDEVRTDKNEVRELRAADPAYVIYTSGSTGRPKGCLVSHGNVARLFTATNAWFGFGQDDVWTLFHSVAFDFSVWEIWGALAFGGRLVIVPYLMSREPEAFGELLRREGVTVLNQTPSAFRQLITAEEKRAERGGLALRQVIFGGEALEPASLRPWVALYGAEQPRLVNMYGITETTVHVTYRPLGAAEIAVGREGGSLIGAPIPDLQLYVLDVHGQPSPVGVDGEIYVGGVGVALGYLNRDELTARRFLPDKFSGVAGARLYRTGDLARRLPDGDVEYRGRMDLQVKIRGFRIELGEIEAALLAHHAVREAAVLAVGDAGEKRLGAYVTLRERGSMSGQVLRQFLAARLPDYMTPAHVVVLDRFPLTPNGKRNDRALPKLDTIDRSGATQDSRVGPRDAIEQVLCSVWEEALGVANVGVMDNYFELGGDSIRSLAVRSLAAAHGVEFLLSELFGHPTVAELARVARRTAMGAGGVDDELGAFALVSVAERAALPADVEDAFPLTRLQAGMLFHSEFSEGATMYHDVFAFRVRMPFDGDRLRTALTRLGARHELLRASFHLAGNGEPLVWIHRVAEVGYEMFDLCGQTAVEQERVIVGWITNERVRGFEVTQAPLMRVAVHRLDDAVWQVAFSLHHAVMDGWSFQQVLGEVFDDCRGATVAKPTPVPPFRHFVALERAALAAEVSRAFWRERIAGAPFARLPRWRAERTIGGNRRFDILISAETGGKLRRVARDLGLPLKSLLFAVHVRVLAGLCNQRDLVTGFVTNGRPETPGADRMVGLFLNTLPMRVTVVRQPWRAFVRGLHVAEQAVLPHRRFPLAEMQKLRGGTELFETDFNFVNFHTLAKALARSGVEVAGAHAYEETNFALTADFSVEPHNGELRGSLGYRAALFDEEQVAEWADAYGRAVSALANDPDADVLAESVLTVARRTQVLHEWNATTTDFGPFVSVQAQTLAVVARMPEQVAVRCEGRTLTFSELEQRSRMLAAELCAGGVRRGMIVGVCLDRSPQLVVALLGILRAGAAYLPVDPDYPAERIVFMMEDSAMAALVTERGLVPQRLAEKTRVVLLEESDQTQALNKAADVWRDEKVSVDDPAYVIYTSGSTGRPKGVVISHGGLWNHMAWMRQAFPLRPDDRVLQKTPSSFDASVWEFWAPLTEGAELVLARPGGHQEPDYLIETIQRARITVLQAVPSLLSVLADHPQWGGCTPLRRVFAGGEALTVELKERLSARLPAIQVINLYGPTETTIDATSWTCRRGEGIGGVPLGRPIANLRVYVLDADLQPVPVGAEGELWIGGAGVALGYLNRPELTKERFVADLFAVEVEKGGTREVADSGRIQGSRMYRTGDLARWGSDGVLHYAGRIDQQVKVRGFRVEPGEVEAALRQHPTVGAAAVRAWETRLAAYVSPVNGVMPTTDGLREFLRDRLPAQLVPTVFVVLDRIPTGPSGKTDYARLPRPDASEAARADYAEPQTETERALAALWETVLGVKRVGLDDNFFALGGDSILSLQIVARFAATGWKLAPRALFEAQTVRTAAARTVRLRLMERSAASQVEVLGPVMLLPIQRMFFARHGARHHWNQAVLLRARETFDVAAARHALAAVMRTHAALRLRFRVVNGCGEAWLPAEAGEPVFDLFDWTALRDDEAAVRLQKKLVELHGALDLERGPVWRAAWFALPAGDGRLFIVAHHLVVDAVSWRIIASDFMAAYAAVLRGAEPTLMMPATSVAAWARRIQELATEGRFEDEREFWNVQLPTAEECAPVKEGFEETKNSEAAAIAGHVVLTMEETAWLLHEAPRYDRTQLNDWLLAALARALKRWTGRATNSVHLEGHGREDEVTGLDATRTVGWFTALYPLKLTAEDSLRGTLRAVKDAVRRVPNRGLGFGAIWRQEGKMKTSEPVKEPWISFNYLGQIDGGLVDDALLVPAPESAGPERDPAARRQHLVDVLARVSGGRLHLECWVPGAAFVEGTAEQLAITVVEELRALRTACEAGTMGGATPADFPLVELDQTGIDRLVTELPALDELLPVTPLQAGLLTRATEGAGFYVQQVSVVLRGELNRGRFEVAWRGTIARHEILRAGFTRDERERPVMFVASAVEPAFAWLDWRELSEIEVNLRWVELLRADRAHGFDPTRAPLLRFTVVRAGESAWRFLWSHHHLILDGWSLPILFREVMERYREPTIERAPVPAWRDYLVWLQGQDAAEAERFWRGALEGFESANRIHDPETDGKATVGAHEHEVVISVELSASIQRFCQTERVTLNTLFAAAWALAVARGSGQEDVVFGVTVSGRPPELRDVERRVGLFINTLPLRVNASPRTTRRALLAMVQAAQTAVEGHAACPLADVQRWGGAGPGRPLFETLFIFENYPLERDLTLRTNGELVVEAVESQEQTEFPLTAYVFPGREIRLRLAARAGRFSEAGTVALLDRFARAVQSLVAKPELAIGSEDLLSDAERERETLTWNATDEPLDLVALVPQRFGAAAARYANKPAVVCDGATLSYAELNARAERLAAVLRRRGARPETLVGLHLERSMDMMVALLAVLKSGAGYVPLDPGFPTERIAMMIEDSRPVVIVVDAALRDRLAEGGAGGATLVGVDGETEEAPDTIRDAESRVVVLRPENTAYVLFTSGSTGRPKGVQVPHRALANFLATWERRPGLRADDALLAVTTLSFDISALELLLPLITGATVWLATRAETMEPAALLRLLPKVSVMQATPATWKMLTAGEWRPPSGLRVWCGGEALPVELAARLREGGAEVWNVYGPTETTIWSLIQPVILTDDARSIGRPIGNTQVYVVDAGGQLVTAGVPGELLIGGDGVARGYLGRADFTAERFVPAPWGSRPGARVYRTGDLVRRRADGTIEFLGRVDQQVKVRGFRIELGEIEAALKRQAGVRDAVVVARNDAAGEKELVAYVVAEPAETECVAGWRAGLVAVLPDYMVPAHVMRLDALPLTPNGKIDRGALPQPNGSFVEARRAWEAPQGEVEEAVAEIWRSVLGVERVGRADNFFALGGHSLKAAQVTARVQKVFQVELALRELFDATTVVRFAEVLVARVGDLERVRKIAAVYNRLQRMTPEEKARLAARAAAKNSNSHG
jgi:amino acid adenylation domain-containing protein/non-ribosomal peptide synthase protein (TIGR01720 family)